MFGIALRRVFLGGGGFFGAFLGFGIPEFDTVLL